MSSIALMGCAQILVGVDALLHFRGMAKHDSTFPDLENVAFAGYILKATGHLLAGISLVALGALHLLAELKVWKFGALLVCNGTFAPITIAALGIVIAHFTLQLLSAMIIAYGARESGKFYATDYTFQQKPRD